MLHKGKVVSTSLQLKESKEYLYKSIQAKSAVVLNPYLSTIVAETLDFRHQC